MSTASTRQRIGRLLPWPLQGQTLFMIFRQGMRSVTHQYSLVAYSSLLLVWGASHWRASFSVSMSRLRECEVTRSGREAGERRNRFIPDPYSCLNPCNDCCVTPPRPSSPAHEGPGALDALVDGVQLIVSKLPRDSVTSAGHYLRALLGEYVGLHGLNSLVPVRVVAGDERNAVDHAFVSVDPAVTLDTRPDLLNEVRHVLTSVCNSDTAWRVGREPDRSRRIHFQVDTFAQADALQPKLSNYLDEKGHAFQCSFISRTMNRVTVPMVMSSLTVALPLKVTLTVSFSTDGFTFPAFSLTPSKHRPAPLHPPPKFIECGSPSNTGGPRCTSGPS
jgi:hypothetical protein